MARESAENAVEKPQYDEGSIPTCEFSHSCSLKFYLTKELDMGAHGNKLGFLITATSTTGFMLFGYGESRYFIQNDKD